MISMRRHHGFTLIEIMVGLVIGLIATVIIFQVFAVSERQKRTTTGAADAQGNGAIGLFMMQRDVRMAGWGLQQSAFGSCSNLYTFDVVTGAPLANNGASLFASVVVTDGGTGPDTVKIQYYDNPANEFRFSATTLRETMPQSSSELKVFSPRGCCKLNSSNVCDEAAPEMSAIITDGSNCTLMSITAYNESAATLQHNPATSNQRYNPSTSYQSTNNWPAYSKGATVQCFSDLYHRTYRINNRQLEVVEPNPSASGTQTLQVAPDIVDLQAEYGVEDTTKTPPIEWVPATGATWAAPTIANVRRIKAVRVAIVARSGEYEKPEGTACDATTTTAVAGWSSWASFDTSTYPADWQCYRYKVFEAVIPLRNIIWANL